MAGRDFFQSKFGFEAEFTGITRTKAADIVAKHLEGTIKKKRDGYDTHEITAADGRVWKIVYDSSIQTQKKVNGEKVGGGKDYSVELVSPILTYDADIETLQEMIRKLRKAGAFAHPQNRAGIHIHLNGADHTPRSVRNFVNIIYARNDLLYESLQIEPSRMRYCKKMDADLVQRMNLKKPKTFKEIEEIWYQGYNTRRDRHYHDSRYHFLNLHSFFNGVGTLELRAFNNPNLHAGIIRAFLS